MNILKNISARISSKKQNKWMDTDVSNDALILHATYNYGVSLFHLGQDWAYDHAIETFKKMIKALSSANTEKLFEIRELAQGSLACTYAKLAERRIDQKITFSDLAFEQTKTLLESKGTNNLAKSLAYAANGLAHLNTGSYVQAIDAFRSSLELDENITALLGMGEAYQKGGMREEAIDAYQKANEMTSNGGYAAYRLGNLFREAGNKEMAIEAYKRASALSVARLALGKIYLEDDELEAALEEFRKAVNINRKNSEALVNIAWTILEMQSADEQLTKESVNAARRAVQIDIRTKNEWHRRTILALSLIAVQKPEQALREAKLGFDLSSDRAQTKFCVALCEFHLGRQENAREILLEILHSGERGLWRTKAEGLMREIKKEG